MDLLFQNIKSLLPILPTDQLKVDGASMQQMQTIDDAWLHVQHGLIAGYGSMQQSPNPDAFTKIIDASNRLLMPTWVDSHTHLVYAADRASEFVDRIRGLSYAEIAQKGGGILNSAKKLSSISEQELYDQSAQRLEEVIGLGTGAIEIKSGYGLNFQAERKMLRVIERLKQDYPIPIKATFLGAHAVPEEFTHRRAEYVKTLCEQWLPALVDEGLVDYIDVFCEQGYFSVEDTQIIMQAGLKLGIQSKIHVNQFSILGGVQAAVSANARSVDHLEELSDQDIEALVGSSTMPVALPGCSYFLGIPYTPARRIIDAGAPLAVASDFNPGSAPSGNMNHVVSAACIKMKMLPSEAIYAATINGAYAIGLSQQLGSISVGKKANLILTKPVPSLDYLPYAFGSSLIENVFIDGKAWTVST